MAASMVGMASKKRLQDMNVDEFLGADFDSESESSSTKSMDMAPLSSKSNVSKRSKSDSEQSSVSKVQKKTEKGKSKKLKKEKPDKTMKREKEVKSSKNSRHSLANTLKETDPEFYDFLKGQDKNLLDNLEDLSESDSGSEYSESADGTKSPAYNDDAVLSKNDKAFEKELLNMSSGEDSDSDEGNSGGVHKIPEKLEVASDDSADEDESFVPADLSKGKKGILVTNGLIEKWTRELQSKPSVSVLRELISAFHAAVQEAGGDESGSTKYRVEGGTLFNSVIRLCLTQIVPALQTLLQIPVLSDVRQPMSDKSAMWKKLKVLVKSYATDLMELLTQLSEAAMVNVVLKHVHKLVIFFASFPKLTKLLLKRMIRLWSTGEETTRVLSFLCINKLVHLKQDALLESSLRQMYMAYVSNCKFTSPTTLPLINFMQRSLVEMFTIDHTVAYQYAFVYIRQLAIHLRNAISVKKKNTCQAVYNWQFMHCLGLWVQLLCITYPNEILQPLIYPLTQTIIGTIKLLPTSRYYPLRFHCIRYLNQLSNKTSTFIPTVPFLLEVFEQQDFNKKHKTVSLKPFNFAVILKLSKSQLCEKAFKDGLIDQLYEHLLESFNIQCHSVGFPELILPSVLQLKDFLKKCKIANYCKQIKQIVDKIQEQAKFIVEKRKRANLSLDDFQAVSMWEAQLADSGTPLRKYYTSWRKLRDRELQHDIANKESVSGAAIDIPTIERKKPNKATPKEREDFSKLFENDSDSDDETRFLLKEERPDKGSRKRKHEESDSEDYSDFDDDELEQLAQSASSGDESENDENVDIDDDDDDDDDDEEDEGEKVEKIQYKKEKQMQSARKKTASGHTKTKVVSKSVNQNSGADEEDMVEDFVLSDFESD